MWSHPSRGFPREPRSVTSRRSASTSSRSSPPTRSMTSTHRSGPIPRDRRLNTIDAGAPTSGVSPLPAATTTTTFTVNWSGTDDTGGSGIATFDVYSSDNGGPFSLWQQGTTATSASFTGVNGHVYGFSSVATDNVGNRQATPTSAQATTTVTPRPQPARSPRCRRSAREASRSPGRAAT